MAETKERDTEVKDGELPVSVSVPAVGEADAGYVSPDLSFKQGAGILPPEEEEWNEARNSARDEDVERVEAGEEEAAERRAKEREEEAERSAEQRKTQLEHDRALQAAIAESPSGRAASEARKPAAEKPASKST